MKTHIIIGIILISVFFSNCKKEGIDNTFFSANQTFRVVNEEGQDLLDPDTEGAIDLNKLTIYFLVNGEKMTARDYLIKTNPGVMLDNLKAYTIYQYDDEYILNVFLNDSMRSNGAISHTYIEWNEDDVDTIKAESSVAGTHSFQVTMVQFNDTEVPPEEREKTFTIVK